MYHKTNKNLHPEFETLTLILPWLSPHWPNGHILISPFSIQQQISMEWNLKYLFLFLQHSIIQCVIRDCGSSSFHRYYNGSIICLSSQPTWGYLGSFHLLVIFNNVVLNKILAALTYLFVILWEIYPEIYLF